MCNHLQHTTTTVMSYIVQIATRSQNPGNAAESNGCMDACVVLYKLFVYEARVYGTENKKPPDRVIVNDAQLLNTRQ